ncbi:hypothetical protein AB205_0134370 [Pelobates cultripes]|uniref:C2H2-type domain-containing protein n=1 Tax=Pelobates cultripes TaxID=61616 RepID=A0AAD1RWH1_PELCU|nr:hypothetical protein AB205_0134370 [Pelobates cultripes]
MVKDYKTGITGLIASSHNESFPGPVTEYSIGQVEDTHVLQESAEEIVRQNTDRHFLHESIIQNSAEKPFTYHTGDFIEEFVPPGIINEPAKASLLVERDCCSPRDAGMEANLALGVPTPEDEDSSYLLPEPDFVQIIKVEEIDTDYKTSESPVDVEEELLGEAVYTAIHTESPIKPKSQFLWLAEGRILVQDLRGISHSRELKDEEGSPSVTPVNNGGLEEITTSQNSRRAKEMERYSTRNRCHKMLLEQQEIEVVEKETLSCKVSLKGLRHEENMLGPKHTRHTHSTRHTHHSPCDKEGMFQSGQPHTVKFIKDFQHFTCTVCGRRFSQRFALSRHQKIHTRDKLFPKTVAPPPQKVYRLPLEAPVEDFKTREAGVIRQVSVVEHLYVY